MKTIAILTEDFSVYHDVVRALKRRDLHFESLVFDEPIPERVGAVITTEAERHRVPSGNVVVVDGDARHAVASAVRLLEGKDRYDRLLIGIDPGEKPGFAVVGDGDVVYATEAKGPEAVGDLVEEAIEAYPSASNTLRVGDGAGTRRDRILNVLTRFPVPVELVDEDDTTPSETRMSGERNIEAAINIALEQGREIPNHAREPDPTAGEIRDIQHRSRRESQGLVTIRRELARKVARGEMTMQSAIDVQKGDRRG